jgi:hypothetical protein
MDVRTNRPVVQQLATAALDDAARAELFGFGTMTIHAVQHHGETATVIYVGWTMISNASAVRAALQRALAA